MNRRTFLKLSALSLPALNTTFSKMDRPNILWITCEDISAHLGCYGDSYAITPNIDEFSSKSVRYKNAYATAPVCTPVRSSIITGVFASSLGTQHLRGQVPLTSKVRCFTEYLRDKGYYCSNNVKEDYNFKTPETAWNESSKTAHWRNRRLGQPFFSVFNFTLTHQSQTRYVGQELQEKNKALARDKRHDPKQAPIPPYYPDTPLIRENVAALYTQITLLDIEVKNILDQLKEDDLDQDTIIFFYSDHGDGLPRGKRWPFDTGLKVPFIIHFPEKYQSLAPTQPGGATDWMINFIDLAPTVLSLLGITPPDYMQGKAFLGEYKSEEKEYVYAIRDRVDEVYEFSRTVRDKRYRYIRNFMPHRPRMQRSFFSERTPIRKELSRLHAKGALSGKAAWLMQDTKPAEELYDTQTDPSELKNLANKPGYHSRCQNMHEILKEWMVETRDTSLLPEPMMLARANGDPPYDMAQDNQRYPIERIFDVADLVGMGDKHIDTIMQALGDSDSAVRYWAAVGLAALREKCAPAREQLLETLEDFSPCVRFATAEALCYINQEEKAVPVLIKGLQIDNLYVQLLAAQTLFAIGNKAKPAIPQMRQTVREMDGLKDHGWYIRELLSFQLERFMG
jgi:uncharacterized sulfatase